MRLSANSLAQCNRGAYLAESDFLGDPHEVKKGFALSIDAAVEKTGAPQAVLFILASARIDGKDLDSLDANVVMKTAVKTVRHVAP